MSWPTSLLVALVLVAIGGGTAAAFTPEKATEILGPTGIIVAFLITKISDAKSAEAARELQKATSDAAALAAREAGQAAREAARAATEAIKASVSVQENAVQNDQRLVKLTGIVVESQKTIETVETQTNSATGALLRRTAEILRSFANSSGDPKDEEVALSAEKDYEQHERGQAIIAAAAGKPPILGTAKRIEAIGRAGQEPAVPRPDPGEPILPAVKPKEVKP